MNYIPHFSLLPSLVGFGLFALVGCQPTLNRDKALVGADVWRPVGSAEVAAAAKSPLVSVFFFSIDDIAKERGIAYGEVARLLREAGVSGFDCAFDNPRLDAYLATGLKPSNLYGKMNFLAADGGVARAQAFVDTAVRTGCPRIMLLPDDFTNGEPDEAEFGKIVDGVRMLVAKGRAQGVAVMVETYGNRKNCCSHAAYVRRLLDAVPGLCFAADTGNLHYAGRADDIVGLVRAAGKRIAHVHLKDIVATCSSEDVRKLRPFCSIGLGVVPNEAVVRHVASNGYVGWYTLEHPVKGDTLGDVRRQIATLKRWLSEPPPPNTRKEWTRTLVVEKDRYIGWPSVVTLRDGTLAAVFSGDRDWHADPYGKIQFVTSTDDGRTWSEPRTIADTIIDDRDCGIVELPDGEILVTWFTSTAWRRSGIYKGVGGGKMNPEIAMAERWVERDKTADHAAEKAVFPYCAIRSRDGGKTWGEIERLKIGCSAPHGPVALRDGSLLLVGRYGAKIEDGSTRTFIRAERSTDGGRTWKVVCGRLATASGENDKPNLYHEPTVAELPSGRLLTLVRYEGGDGCLRQATSDDGGTTWTALEKTPLRGMPAHLTALRDGRLLAVYSRRKSDRPNDRGIFAAISPDEGRTWDVEHEIALGERIPKEVVDGHFGYPCSTLTADGGILTVYYAARAKGFKPALEGTKWIVESKKPETRNQ